MFIRTKIINGKTYRSLEERYREGGKVKSRYIRSLTSDSGLPNGTGAHFQGEVAAFDGMVMDIEKAKSAQLVASSEKEAAKDADSKTEGVNNEVGVEVSHSSVVLAAASKEPSNTDSKDVGEGDKSEAGGNQGSEVGDNGGGQGGGKGGM